MHDEKDPWTPKVGDEVVYQPPYRRQGITAPSRRGIIISFTEDQKVKLRIKANVYVETKAIYLRLIK